MIGQLKPNAPDKPPERWRRKKGGGLTQALLCTEHLFYSTWRGLFLNRIFAALGALVMFYFFDFTCSWFPQL
jgi:hypothetical protein